MKTTCLIGHRVANPDASTTGGRRKLGAGEDPSARHAVMPPVTTAATTTTLTAVHRNDRGGGAGESPFLTYRRGGRTSRPLTRLPSVKSRNRTGPRVLGR